MAQAPKSITDPRVRFFYANAGYAKKAGESVHSATLRNAKALADAENYAEDHGWTYQWEEDPQGYDSLGEDEDPEDIEVLWVQLLDESGASLASLGGVNLRKDRGIKDKYARVVEAELALEAMVEGEGGGVKRNASKPFVAWKEDVLGGSDTAGGRAMSRNGSGSATDFIEQMKSQAQVGDRQIWARHRGSLGGAKHGGSVTVNYINLPTGIGGAGGGAEAENNRMLFIVDGFGYGPDDPSPTGKVKIEMSMSTLPREYKLRAKTGTPAAIATYLADFLSRVAADVPPHFTHTQR